MTYLVRRAQDVRFAVSHLNGAVEEWNSPAWQQADVLDVAHFRPESSSHRPVTQVRLLHDDMAIYAMFRVQDRFVRSVQTEYCGPVCTDSCVEWFAQPRANSGYLNFEINCGGVLLSSYIEDATRTADGFKRFTHVMPAHAAQITIVHSMPAVVDPEVVDAVTWVVQYRVPLALFESYAGPLGALSGQEWQCNFYKCGDHTSHPHWASWSPVQELNFHRPQDFAPVRFE